METSGEVQQSTSINGWLWHYVLQPVQPSGSYLPPSPNIFMRNFIQTTTMTDNFYLTLAAILFLPVLPAFILYKFLPSDTDVAGPFQGLSLKLKGAFAGYFLLVIVGLVLQYAIMNNSQQKTIESLTRNSQQNDTTIRQLQGQLQASANPVIDWHIKGAVTPAGKEGTRFFYDDGTTTNAPDGSFELIKRSIAKEGTARPPKWMCIYNAVTGFKVISLNRDIAHPDIKTYDIGFDDAGHQIIFRKLIDINSIEKDSVVAVANFIERNPELKLQVERTDPMLLQKANLFRKEKLLNPANKVLFQNSIKANQ